MDTKFIQLDARRRGSFGSLGGEASLFLAEEHPDGRIVLTPASLVSEATLAWQANADLANRVAVQMNNPQTWLDDSEFWTRLRRPDLAIAEQKKREGEAA